MVIYDEFWSKYKHSDLTSKPNYLKIPVTYFKFDEDGVNEFNRIYEEILDNKPIYSKIIRTRSGGISYKDRNFMAPCYDVKSTYASVELTLCNEYGFFRFIIGNANNSQSGLYTGHYCFKKFKELLKKDGIDLDTYRIENGEEVKTEIDKYLIDVIDPNLPIGEDAVYEHAYHCDYHNSFASGLAITHPEFAPTLNKIHQERLRIKKLKKISILSDDLIKKNDLYKAILTHSIGYMQSLNVKNVNGCWAHLSRDAINNNNDRVRDLCEDLIKHGYKPLVYNTDGIWYQDINGLGAFSNDSCGDQLGQWSNDHCDVTVRFKSKGSYEYMENGKCYPVVRGATRLDKIKPRDEWEWGDIFKIDATIINYKFDENLGVIKI